MIIVKKYISGKDKYTYKRIKNGEYQDPNEKDWKKKFII